MANNIESIEIFPDENGGHRVVHNFKREAGKKSGAMGGGVYMERPKPDEHFFTRAKSNGRPFAPELSEPPLSLPAVTWVFNHLGRLLSLS